VDTSLKHNKHCNDTYVLLAILLSAA